MSCVCALGQGVCGGVVVPFTQETFLAFRHNFDHFAFQDMGTEKQIISGKYVVWVILNSTLQITQVSCFLPKCYNCRFIAVWSTLLSCFGISECCMLLKFIVQFLEVCGLSKFLTIRTFCSSTLCKPHLHRQE